MERATYVQLVDQFLSPFSSLCCVVFTQLVFLALSLSRRYCSCLSLKEQMITILLLCFTHLSFRSCYRFIQTNNNQNSRMNDESSFLVRVVVFTLCSHERWIWSMSLKWNASIFSDYDAVEFKWSSCNTVCHFIRSHSVSRHFDHFHSHIEYRLLFKSMIAWRAKEIPRCSEAISFTLLWI